MLYLMAAYVGASIASSIAGNINQRRQNKIAQEAADLQAKEIQRQRKLEEQRQRRENDELMNSVSNLTNTSWSGANAPTISFDKYGDLG
ncbi:MAG: hypothetical protein IIV02_01025 [Peptococcaceae bacterium]|nr:hypothetical protein [Peptococcaceae bacterium]